METRIIKAVFGASKSIVAPKRFKNDWGQVLELVGITLPQTFTAHFANSKTGTAKKRIGQNNQVDVPDEFFTSGADIFCWVMVHDTVSDGRTMYTVRIPIEDRGTATDEEPTPVQQDVIEQAIAALNAAVEQTAQDVESADASAQSAKADADRAETARDTAEGYVVDVQNYAQQAQASASNASASATASANSASQAQQIKINIESMVDEAQSAAGASAQSALESAQSASQASASATAAGQSASTANTKAGEASTSAQTASGKATEASGYASTASTKASEASQSASAASGYATAAGQAKTAAETAQGLAEQAQSDAESAKDAAESARDEAQQIVSSISGKVEQIDQNTADIASLEADRYKAYATDTATGAVASFPDGADDVPMVDVKVQIEPVQDLHGQANPYPAGGGKNLLQNIATSGSTNGITYTVSSDGMVTVNGTATANAYINITSTTGQSLPAGTYILNGCPSGGGANKYNLYDNGTNVDTGSGVTFTLAEETAKRVIIRIISGTTVNNLVFKPMIRLASVSDSTFAPYSNICPISGWTEVDVEQRGINVWDEEWEVGGIKTADGTTINISGCVCSKDFSPIIGGASYYIKSIGGSAGVVYIFFYGENKDYIGYDSASNNVVVAPDNARFFKIQPTSIYGETYNHDISINYPATDTAYHAYNGNTYSVDWTDEAGTVYGGTLDVTTGVLTVDRAMVDLGSFHYSLSSERYPRFRTDNGKPENIKSQTDTAIPINGVCEAFPVVSAEETYRGVKGLSCQPNGDLRIYAPSYPDVESFQTAMQGVQLVYELAEPIHYTLDSTEIRSLLGQNNVFADTGDTTAEYRADTKLYIQKKIAEAISALS